MSRPLTPRTKRERMPGGSVAVSSGVASIVSSRYYLRTLDFSETLLCFSFEPRNRAFPHAVAAGELGEGGTLGPASAGLGLLRGRQFLGTAHMLAALLRPAAALGGAGADQIALQVREAAENSNHQAPGAGAGVGPR